MGEEEGYQDQQSSGGQNLLSQIVASEETIQELSKALLPSLLASLDSANRGGADRERAENSGEVEPNHWPQSRPHPSGAIRRDREVDPNEVGGWSHPGSGRESQGSAAPSYQSNAAPSYQGNAAYGQVQTAESNAAPHNQSNAAPYQSNVAPYQSNAAPYQSNAAPYQSNPAPYQSNPAPYQSNAAPYQSNAAPYQSNAAPYQSNAAPPARQDFAAYTHPHGYPSGPALMRPMQNSMYAPQPTYPWQGQWYSGGSSMQPGSGSSASWGRPQSVASTSRSVEADDDINPFVSESERRDLLSSSSSDSEEDSEISAPPAKRKFVPGEETTKLLNLAVEKPLKNDKRKSVAGRFPLPNCDAVYPPKLDDAVTCLIPKSAKSYDRFLSKLQQFTVDAFGPLVFIQDRLSKGEPIDQATLKAAVKSGVSLLGNATAHFSTERRKCVMKHLNSDLKPLAEGQFPDRGAYLFGDSFGTRAKAAADSVKALKGIQPRKRFLGNGGSKFKPQSRQQQWGVSAAGTSKSIFKRLGPHQGRASLPPARTKFKPRKQPPKQ